MQFKHVQPVSFHQPPFALSISAGPPGAVGEQGDVGAEGPEGLEADVAGLATMGRLESVLSRLLQFSHSILYIHIIYT